MCLFHVSVNSGGHYQCHGEKKQQDYLKKIFYCILQETSEG